MHGSPSKFLTVGWWFFCSACTSFVLTWVWGVSQQIIPPLSHAPHTLAVCLLSASFARFGRTYIQQCSCTYICMYLRPDRHWRGQRRYLCVWLMAGVGGSIDDGRSRVLDLMPCTKGVQHNTLDLSGLPHVDDLMELLEPSVDF